MSTSAEFYQPFSVKTILRISIGVIVILAFLAGYYESRTEISKQMYGAVMNHFHVQNIQQLLDKEWEKK